MWPNVRRKRKSHEHGRASPRRDSRALDHVRELIGPTRVWMAPEMGVYVAELETFLRAIASPLRSSNRSSAVLNAAKGPRLDPTCHIRRHPRANNATTWPHDARTLRHAGTDPFAC